MDSEQTIGNEVLTDLNEPLKKWSQAFACSMLVGIITFGMVSIYADLQGSDHYYSSEGVQVSEQNGSYVASGLIEAPSGISTCDFELSSREMSFGGLGLSIDKHATGDCKSGEFLWKDDDIDEATYDSNSGEFEIIFHEDPGRVWVEISGEYYWKLSWEGFIGLYVLLNIVGLILIGKKFGVLPAVVFSIPAILLPLVLSVSSARSFDIFIN